MPAGTVTFLCTDVEASTALLQSLGDRRYADVLAEHRRLLREAFAAGRGREVDTQGDAFLVVFARASDAVAAARTAQLALLRHPWPEGASPRVRIGLHTGEPVQGTEGYVGLDVHRAARICSAGHGGQILVSEPTRALVAEAPPDGMSFQELGEHRLKDLAEPMRLFQVVAAELPLAFPPLNTLDDRPNNLPAELTTFIGRDREIAEVKGLFPAARLVTLTGFAGVGKTRLALRAAADLLPDYPHGAWLAELAPLTDGALVAKAVAAAFGLREQSGGLTEALTAFLRSKTALLVLDNCEHLIAACAGLAETLLRTCPDLRLLATSREPLGILGEVVWRVPALSIPSLKELPPIEELSRYEAVLLFTDRAALSRPGFRLTSSNAAAVVQVTRRLDGIPLAIELAAARVKTLPAETIAAKLDDRFRLLTGGARTALPHRQTMRAALDWSYDLLAEPERVVLRRLSVFAGGFSAEAAEQVCGDDAEGADILDRLTSLVDKSLVVFDERVEPARYGLLESVRQYAGEKLERAGEAAAVRRRHCDWCLGFAERAAAAMSGPEAKAWMARFDAEHDNFRSALEWSSADPGGADAALRLAGRLSGFWNFRGHWHEGRGWLERALARSDEAPREVLPAALQGATYFAFEQHDYKRATELGEWGVAVCRDVGDRPNMCRLLRWLGVTALRQRDTARGTALLEEGLGIAREMNDPWQTSATLAQLGIVARRQGEYDRAVVLHEECLALAKTAGDGFLIAFNLRNLGYDALEQHDQDRAQAYFADGLTLSRDLNHRWVIGECLEGLGVVARNQGQYDRAARLLGAAGAVLDPIGNTRQPEEQAALEERTAATRLSLGDAAFDEAWTHGQAMTLEQAVEYALPAGRPG